MFLRQRGVGLKLVQSTWQGLAESIVWPRTATPIMTDAARAAFEAIELHAYAYFSMLPFMPSFPG